MGDAQLLHRYVSAKASNVQDGNYHTFLFFLLSCRVNTTSKAKAACIQTTKKRLR